jgi:acetyl esterase/lipase
MNIIIELAGVGILLFCLYDLLTVNYQKPVKWVYRLTKSYRLQLGWNLFLAVIGLGFILQGLVPSILTFLSAGIFEKIGTILSVLLLGIGLALYGLLFSISVKPNQLIHWFRGARDKEAIYSEAPKKGPAAWQNDYYLTENISFPSRYPNHFFDIYQKDLTETHPVFVYAHGGGYIFGGKANGDPNALGIPGVIRMIKQLLDAGFTVISTDYVFAPEYRYPAPVIQMNELLSFLQANAERLNLDMDRVVLGGGSAGGQLMAQTANIHTHPAYAEEMKIQPALRPGQIKAVYHGCALLDNERFGRTGNVPTDYVFYQMGRAYFALDVLEGNPQVIQSDVIRHVTENYPASFICDGNVGTFNSQAHDLADRLQAIGVNHKAMIFDEPGAKKLPHGFDTLEHDRGYRSMEEMVAFVKGEVFCP